MSVKELLKSIVLVALVLALFVPVVLADSRDIVVWDFDDSNTIPSTDEPTGSTATGGSGLTGPTWREGNPSSGKAWCFSNWNQGISRGDDDYFEFNINLSNFGGLTLYFDEHTSATGPGTYDVRYSTDGSTFSDVVTGQSTHGSFSSSPMNTISLSSIDNDIRGQSSVTFRIYGYNAPDIAGTWRIDNVRFYATTGPNSITLISFNAASVAPLSPLAVVLPALGLATLTLAGLLWAKRRRLV